MTVELGSISDYVGRTVDLLAFQGQRLRGGDRLLAQTLLSPAGGAGAPGGELCAGVQKLAQRWLLEFMTTPGSMVNLPGRGCAFMRQLRRGELRTTVDAVQAFQLAADRVRVNLQDEESATTPDDEALAAAELEGMAVAGDRLTMTVRILSRAGYAALLVLPVAVNNG